MEFGVFHEFWSTGAASQARAFADSFAQPQSPPTQSGHLSGDVALRRNEGDRVHHNIPIDII